MVLDPSRFVGKIFPEKRFRYTERDTQLYALSVGMAQDPLDRNELVFACGPNTPVLPTQATVIAWDYDFILGSGIDEAKILHGAQSVTIHSPLPAAADVISRFAVTDLFDKGPGNGAVIVARTEIFEEATGRPLCTNVWTSYARGEGGFGGERGPSSPVLPAPSRAPDHSVDSRTWLNQPLFYRLLGDVNPLHSDPDFAALGGFDRPIMHGLCTYGIACRAVVATTCAYDPRRMLDFRCQFAAPAIPGDTIRTDIWTDGDAVTFRCRAVERAVDVAVNGRASIAPRLPEAL